jgi:two-component system NtrC family sensor kinase
MRIKLSIVLMLAIYLGSYSQNDGYLYEPVEAEMDSLRSAYKNADNDSLKMELSRKIAFYFHEKNTDTAIYFHHRQLELAQKLNLKIWEADALELLGFMSQHQGQYPQSMQYFQQSLQIAEDPSSEKDTYRSDLLSSKASPRAARLTVLAFIHIDRVAIFAVTRDYDKVVASLREAVRIAHIIEDHAIMSFGYGTLGDKFFEKNELDSAMLYQHKALLHADTANYPKYNGGIYSTIGMIYAKRGDFKNARKYYNKSVEESLLSGNHNAISGAYLQLAELFIEREQLDSSLFYLKKGLELSIEVNFPRYTLRAYRLLASIFAQTNYMDSAYYYQSKAIATSDGMLSEEKIIHLQNLLFSEQIRLEDLQEEKEKYQNKVRVRALISGFVLILVIAVLLYRNNRSRRKALNLVQRQRNDLQSTITELNNTQAQLIHSEKMASLGELTAGIAHEIQNPLNFVNNFSEVSVDLLDEMKDEVKEGNFEEVKEILEDLKQNLDKISQHGHRASTIVKGMLEHSRTGDGTKEATDINELADEYLRLAYHGLRAKDKTFNAAFSADLDDTLQNINIVPQDIGRVLLNMINNAFYAVSERSKAGIEGYAPTVSISTKRKDQQVEIRVKDNGTGIPKEVREKIFQPFFTTKPSGEGTGLGLSLAFDIITKGHDGELHLESAPGEGTEFIIVLPI